MTYIKLPAANTKLLNVPSAHSWTSQVRSAVILIANNSTFVSLHNAAVALITTGVMGQA